ncbi:MAG: hypothetical protein QM572_08995 [Nocardioides sp.]|uniref:hypothetical protein n=1 Tax=Nocardioides sp. TaxID=35761 RepID=UPI0039E46E38
MTLHTCEGSFDHIEIRHMLGGGKSKVIGSYKTTKPVTGSATIDLENLTDGWTATTDLEQVPGLTTAWAWGSHKGSGGSNQATFTFAGLATLPADNVISDLGSAADGTLDGDVGPTMTLNAFHQDLCSRWN